MKEKESGNKMIAEFMGGKLYKKEENNHSFHTAPKNIPIELDSFMVIGDLKYHSSWDWFVPAFHKAQKTKHDKDFCDLILAYIRHDDHINAFKSLINYIDLVVYGNPPKVNMEALKDLKKYL